MTVLVSPKGAATAPTLEGTFLSSLECLQAARKPVPLHCVCPLHVSVPKCRSLITELCTKGPSTLLAPSQGALEGEHPVKFESRVVKG